MIRKFISEFIRGDSGSFQFLNADRSQSIKNAKIRKLGIQKKFRIIDESVIDGLIYNAKFLLYVLNKYSPVGFNAKEMHFEIRVG